MKRHIALSTLLAGVFALTARAQDAQAPVATTTLSEATQDMLRSSLEMYSDQARAMAGANGSSACCQNVWDGFCQETCHGRYWCQVKAGQRAGRCKPERSCDGCAGPTLMDRFMMLLHGNRRDCAADCHAESSSSQPATSARSSAADEAQESKQSLAAPTPKATGTVDPSSDDKNVDEEADAASDTDADAEADAEADAANEADVETETQRSTPLGDAETRDAELGDAEPAEGDSSPDLSLPEVFRPDATLPDGPSGEFENRRNSGALDRQNAEPPAEEDPSDPSALAPKPIRVLEVTWL